MTPNPDSIQCGDIVLLHTNQQWYRVLRGPYQKHNGFTCGPDYKPIPGGWWVWVGEREDGRRSELQVCAIGEVWREDRMVWPPVAKQLELL